MATSPSRALVAIPYDSLRHSLQLRVLLMSPQESTCNVNGQSIRCSLPPRRATKRARHCSQAQPCFLRADWRLRRVSEERRKLVVFACGGCRFTSAIDRFELVLTIGATAVERPGLFRLDAAENDDDTRRRCSYCQLAHGEAVGCGVDGGKGLSLVSQRPQNAAGRCSDPSCADWLLWSRHDAATTGGPRQATFMRPREHNGVRFGCR